MMNDADSDEALVRRTVCGDRQGFRALVERHYDVVFRIAWKWCGNREDAEDIAQDVCVRLARSLQRYDGRSKFSTWLYRVVLNATRDHQRRRRSHDRKLADWASEPSRPDRQPAEPVDPEEEAKDLWAAVHMLPPGQRDAVLLVYSEGLSHKQAARILGCAEGTISSNIHDAKKRLKQLLTEEAGV